jgi:hypothetical protein
MQTDASEQFGRPKYVAPLEISLLVADGIATAAARAARVPSAYSEMDLSGEVGEREPPKLDLAISAPVARLVS